MTKLTRSITIAVSVIVLIVACCHKVGQQQQTPYQPQQQEHGHHGNHNEDCHHHHGHHMEKENKQEESSVMEPMASRTTSLDAKKEMSLPTTKTTKTTKTTTSRLLFSPEEEEKLVQAIREKLRPRGPLRMDDEITRHLEPHQFLHIHHMKSGGTSFDHMLKCAMTRLKDDMNYTFDYYNIHECARGAFKKCREQDSDPCRAKMNASFSMSLCGAIKNLPTFKWNGPEVDAFTVLRNPVDRVWSMFRFEPRLCYQCKNLTDIYDLIDTEIPPGFDSLCLAQLQNHEVANLLSTDWPEDADEDAILQEAIENMKTRFAVIGLTEELPTTMKIMGTVFPWLNTTIEGSHTYCHLPHDNSSPKNNHCIKQLIDGGPKFTSYHWDLPSHPDEETRQKIIAHNQLDIKLYAAAVEYFELQKRVFEGMGEES